MSEATSSHFFPSSPAIFTISRFILIEVSGVLISCTIELTMVPTVARRSA